jgi:hypothetical protein
MIQLILPENMDVRRGELLHRAVRRDDREKFAVLILSFARGADVNRILYSGEDFTFNFHRIAGLGTPLQVAAQTGDVDMLTYLLAKGADPTIPNSNGLLPEKVALYRGHQHIHDLLKKRAQREFAAEKINLAQERTRRDALVG